MDLTERPSKNQALRGVQAAPPEVRELRSGGNTALLEGIDLRYLRAGSFEAVRRIYVAVRDSAWGTIPAEYRITRLEQRADSFDLELEAEHRAGDINFVWQGAISGSTDGTIIYRMDGLARSSFQYNRIGLCMLVPMELRGAQYRADAPDGVIEGVLPDLIGPQQSESGQLQPLFGPFNGLTIAHDGTEIQMELSGDLFETEDQRNWTDASFKIYSTPLSLGIPHTANAGQRITQTVTIKLQGPTRHAKAKQHSSVSVGESSGHPLPAIGFGMASHGEPLSARRLTLLQAVHPDHLRVDVQLDRPLESQLLPGIDASRHLQCPLEVAVFLGANDGEQLDRLAAFLRDRARIARFLIFDRTERASHRAEVTARESMERARLHLGEIGAPLLGGTTLNFCELNRTRPAVEVMDGVVYPINPQVHAADDRSVIENVMTQAETVRTARSFSAGRPIVVSPITLKPQVNLVGGPEGSALEALPTSVDPRQMSLLGAGWTVGSIASLACAGASSLTYYETTGWRGLMEGAGGSPLPDLFPSVPGMVFPLYHVFADVAEWRVGRLVNCSTDHLLTLAALAVQTSSTLHLLVANLTAGPQSIICRSLPESSASIRRLDLQTVRAAVLEPESFRRGREKAVIKQGEVVLDLGPYATLRIDL